MRKLCYSTDMRKINGVPVLQEYGKPAPNMTELVVRIRDLNRIFSRLVFNETKASHGIGVANEVLLQEATDRLTTAAAGYVGEYISLVVLNKLSTEDPKMAKAACNVAMVKLAATSTDSAVRYFAVYGEFNLRWESGRFLFEWTGLSEDAPKCRL